MLKPAETYISVNRPAIETFENDVASFISNHPNYCVSGTSDTYSAANQNLQKLNSFVFFRRSFVDIFPESKKKIKKTGKVMFINILLLSL